ncbi:hypothetical protein NONO_c45550 [Nocardia nova SH22a]|uniref:Uncharacterized protein n=1 Tax=Nocardia nova SH22a TaxID=1415166 RepID=W5TJI0_9NOCA|nr:hypothetical protein [Nocardia nova]AHH19339.1 hypothetical protein NONO_c45550 [Nocardia nova SH22a]
MTFDPNMPLDPCNVSTPGHTSPPCPPDPPPPPNHLLSMDHGSLYGTMAAHASAAWSTAGLVLTGAYFAYAYRRSLGRLVSSPLMARFATKSVYDDLPAEPDRPG